MMPGILGARSAKKSGGIMGSNVYDLNITEYKLSIQQSGRLGNKNFRIIRKIIGFGFRQGF